MGKLWTHSCFSFESLNAIVPKGAKGSGTPIPSIIRNYFRYFYSQIWLNKLSQIENIKIFFPKTFKLMRKHFKTEFEIGNRNKNNLIKIYQNGSFKQWIEKSNNNQDSHYCNFIICFQYQTQKKCGFVEKINQEIEVSLWVQIIDLYQIKNRQIFEYQFTGEYITVYPHQIMGYFSIISFNSKQFLFPFYSI